MPNWGITNFTNPYMLASFGPYAWSSNYGYETQFNIFPDSMTPLMAQYGHGILNPNHISQWNPLFAFPIQSDFTNPQLTAQGMQAAADVANAIFEQQVSGLKLSRSAQVISSVMNGAENLLKSDKLTDAQKEKIQAVRDKAEALKERIEKYQEASRAADADKAALKEDLAAISSEADALCKEFREVCKAIKEEIKENEDKVDGDEDKVDGDDDKVDGDKDKVDGDDDKVDGDKDKVDGDKDKVDGDKDKVDGDKDKVDGDEDKVDGDKDKVDGDKDKVDGDEDKVDGDKDKVDGDDGKVEYSTKYSQSQYQTSSIAISAGAAIAEELFEAIDGLSLNNDKHIEAMNKVNKDNVMEVLDKWNTGRGKEFNESLAESLCADSSGNTEDTFIKQLTDALKAKADEAGINVEEDYNAIQEKLERRWFRDYEGIYEAINNMHKNLGGRPFEKK